MKQAANYYLISLLITDHILDDKSTLVSKDGLMAAFLLRERALHLMHELFESGSVYWIFFDKYYRAYVEAVLTENKYFSGDVPVKEMTMEEMTVIYAGKSALAKAATTALAVKAQKLHLITRLEQSIDNYYIAITLKDDVNDWKQDVLNRQYSYVVSKVLYRTNLEKGKFDHITFGKYLFFSGEAVNTLQLASDFFQRSLDAVSSLDCPDWRTTISNSLQQCQHLKIDIEMLVRKELTVLGVKDVILKQTPRVKIELPEGENRIFTILNYSFNYILNQWERGFEEVKAYCYFPDSNGFTFKNRYAIGDIFQRSVICELFQDIYPLSNSNLAVYLEYETEYLSGCQSQQGGWNFYSNLDMQPCDADTTSQVIKVLLKQGKRHIIRKETIDQLEQWLTINFSSDGYIGSWFIPPVDKCTSHQLQQRNFFRNYVSHDIDTSFDVEVMANVYDMLNELDSFKYADVIDAGLSFLIMNQQHDGSWASTWYFGSYYATYMCTKLLFKLRPSDVSIEKTYWYVKDTQNKDGGWGWTPHKSDPLNTALALLCLHAAHHEVDSKVLQNAVNYLERAVYDVNQLKTCYYINYRKQGLSYFRSNCVSYAYIIKALWLWKGKLS